MSDRPVAKVMWLLVAALLASGAARADPVDDAIAALDSSRLDERLAAVDQLGGSDDPRAVAALAPWLELRSAEAEERERTWLHVARALGRLAATQPLPDETLARLRQLARTEPTVTYMDQSFRMARELPRYRFHEAARSALGVVELAAARREVEAQAAPLPTQQRVDYLAELAWTETDGATPARRIAARERLAALGPAGVDSTVRRIPDADAEARLAMLAYLEAVCPAADPRCTRALLRLSESGQDQVWQNALRALVAIEARGASAELIRELRRDGVSDRPFTYGALQTVGRLQDPGAAPFLAEQLRTGSRRVSVSAANALADLGAAGVAELRLATQSPDPLLRRRAAIALSRAPGPGAREALGEYRKAHPDDEREPWLPDR